MRAVRPACLLTAAALAGGLAGPAAANHLKLDIVSWGGAYTAAQMQAFVGPYRAQVDPQAEVVRYNGGLDEVAAQVRAHNVTWDVVDVGRSDALRGCKMGLFESIDPSTLPPAADGTAPRDDFLDGMLPNCAVGENVFSNVIAYDANRFAGNAPKRAAAFFDLRAFPGRRGMRDNPRGNLELALMADGVPPGKVYDVLSTEAGVSRAFDKLASIAGAIVWWTGAEEPEQLLAEGRVSMTTSYNGRAQSAIDRRGAPIGIVWDHQVLDYELWAVVKGSPVRDKAMNFIRFASDPARQAELARSIAYGPARRSAMALLGDAARAKLPTSAAHMKTALVTDPQWWAAHQAEMQKRFDAFIARARFVSGAPGKGGTL